ncbi:hypothetical protein SFRURICE_000284 [Spodoptera frugiperda]|nr:hypothetical protein SFRURICE_000284 [Spodoptera frugiperda]
MHAHFGSELYYRETWRRHRKLLSPAFTLTIIHSFLDVFNSQAKKLVTSVKPHTGKGPFDLFLTLKLNALETFCLGTLGIDVIDDVNFSKKYMESVDEIMTLLISRVAMVWLRSDVVWKLTGQMKKEQELVDTLHAMTNKVLQRKKAALKYKSAEKVIESETSGIKYRPFLDLLLDLSTNGAITDEEIREETDTIIVAGYDTTSNQLTFILLLLGAHPDVQEKSMRLFPSVPSLFRTVETDVKLKNYTMPAGSYCIIFPIAASKVDPYWGAEPDKFRPERWLHGDFRNNKEYSAFGRTYAMISMKVTLAHFLRQYRVRADLSHLKLNFDFLMKPISGHDISIEREFWQRHRKLLNPAFTVPVIHNFLGIFNHMAKQLVGELEVHADRGPFEISPYLRVISFQTFSRTAFGIADESVKEFAKKYMESSDQVMNLVVYRFQNFLLHSDLIFRLTGLKKKQDHLIKRLDDMANQTQDTNHLCVC